MHGPKSHSLRRVRFLGLLSLLVTASRSGALSDDRLESVANLLLEADVVVCELAHLSIIDTKDLSLF